MKVKINGEEIENCYFKGAAYDCSNVYVPDVSTRLNPDDFDNIYHFWFNQIDQLHYQVLSKTVPTEYMYRFTTDSFDKVADGLLKMFLLN